RADLHPAGPRRRGSRSSDRDRPERGPPEVVREPGEGDRDRRQVLRGAAHQADVGHDPLVRHLAERRRLGRGVPSTRTRYSAQRGARADLGGAAHDPAGHDGDVSADLLRMSLLQNKELRTTFNRAWPLLEAADLVGDLWSVPAYLRKCAPWLSPEDVRQLQRGAPPGLDGVRPAAPGRSSAAARR